MKYLSEYRDPVLARSLVERILAAATRPRVLMEVCGGQTHTIVRQGLQEFLKGAVDMIHGPGCPVCVTPLEQIDRALHLASLPEVIFTSFGDMLRVPGQRLRPAADPSPGRRSAGRVFPAGCAGDRSGHPDREVVFFAVGFETTAPANAMAVWQARELGISNFSVLVSHVTVPPAIRAILDAPDNRVEAFLAAGHVCTVMGWKEYEPLAAEYGVPIVVTGFEPVDILEGIYMAVRQLEEGRAEVENQYARSVRRSGNEPAQELVGKVFELVDRRGAGSARSRLAASACGRSSRRSTRRGSSTSASSGPRSRRSAWRETCCAEGSSPSNVPPSAQPALRRGRWARQWYRRRAPVRRTTTTPGSSPSRRESRRDEDRPGRPIVSRRAGSLGSLRPDSRAPFPAGQVDRVLLGHGSGGKLSAALLRERFLPHFGNEVLAELGDAAVVRFPAMKLRFRPTVSWSARWSSPGGNIGHLAVHGTVNDLAMMGAEPLYLSVGFILEEGLPFDVLDRYSRRCRRRPRRPASWW